MESVSSRVCGSFRSKPATVMLRVRGLVAQRFDRLIGLGFRRVLHLHLQHQVAAALQIEPEMDIVLDDSALSWIERVGEIR